MHFSLPASIFICSLFFFSNAFSIPVILNGVAQKDIASSDSVDMLKQLKPSLQDLQQKGLLPCNGITKSSPSSESSSIKGNFTKRNSSQIAFNSFYCVSEKEYYVIGIVENGRVIVATYASAFHCSVTIEKYPDVNLNGTDELLITENGGDGCAAGSSVMVDFAAGKATVIGTFDIQEDAEGCAFMRPFQESHALYVEKSSSPVFYINRYRTSCSENNAKPVLIKKLERLEAAKMRFEV